LIKNAVLSVVKLTLPFLLIALGAYGIFASFGTAVAVAFSFGLLFLVLKFNYVFKPNINTDIVKRMTRFSLGNYAAGFIGGLPAMVLPILITNSIGARFSAYFYMDMMTANLLYIVPLAVSQSLFAEGSYSEEEIAIHLKKAIKIISLILIPAIILLLLFGKYILLAYGNEYSNEGSVFLQILAVSGIFVAINYIGNSILFIKHKIKLMILINFIAAFTIIYLSNMLSHQDLLGIGVAWFIGQSIVAFIYALMIRNII
jgi:O-antigen/teichoic acid export membrane protein